MIYKSSKRLLNYLIILLFCNFSTFGQESEKIKFDYIKLDNSIVNWGALKLENALNYESLNQDGIPNNLTIQKQIKLISFKFSRPNSQFVQYRYKLLEFSTRQIYFSCTIL
jgi:hypothetical protein